MTDELERAREDVQRAADRTDDDAVREQLRSIDEGLKEMTRSSTEERSDSDRRDDHAPATTEGDVPRGDELQQVEAQLADLGDDAEGRVRELIQDARDRIDDYRRAVTRDW
jgi:hypothetical protein